MSCHHTIHSSLPPSFASFPKSNNFQTRNLPPTDYNVNRTTQIPTEQIVRTLVTHEVSTHRIWKIGYGFGVRRVGGSGRRMKSVVDMSDRRSR